MDRVGFPCLLNTRNDQHLRRLFPFARALHFHHSSVLSGRSAHHHGPCRACVVTVEHHLLVQKADPAPPGGLQSPKISQESAQFAPCETRPPQTASRQDQQTFLRPQPLPPLPLFKRRGKYLSTGMCLIRSSHPSELHSSSSPVVVSGRLLRVFVVRCMVIDCISRTSPS